MEDIAAQSRNWDTRYDAVAETVGVNTQHDDKNTRSAPPTINTRTTNPVS